jgi:hypothetical protein
VLEEDRPAIHLGDEARRLQVGVYLAVNRDQVARNVRG